MLLLYPHVDGLSTLVVLPMPTVFGRSGAVASFRRFGNSVVVRLTDRLLDTAQAALACLHVRERYAQLVAHGARVHLIA